MSPRRRCAVRTTWPDDQPATGDHAMTTRPRRRAAVLLAAALTLLPPCGSASAATRPSALAGGWYPAEPRVLADEIDTLLDRAQVHPATADLRALIVPHAGYRYSGATAAEAFSLVRGRHFARVMVLAPAHRSGFEGLSIADVSAYETPLGEIPLDVDAISGLRASPLVQAHRLAHRQEHAIEIELPLLQRALAPGWRLLPVLIGALDDDGLRAAADLLRPYADARTLVIVSSDFTHYGERFGFLPFPLDGRTAERIRALDDGALETIENKDPAAFLDYRERTGISICGFRPIAVLLSMLPGGAQIRPIAYTTSGALTGDYSSSVSYAALAVSSSRPFSAVANATADPAVDEQGDAAATGATPIGTGDLQRLHRLAVLAIEQAVLGRSEALEAEIKRLLTDLPASLSEPAGAFVTLKRDGRLRGCIGYIEPLAPLYLAVLENAVNAAVNDPRFTPLTGAELDGLEVEVSVLSVPRPIPSADAFAVGEQGIILSKDGHRAVFLPEVASEQGWDRAQTLGALARKAGLAEQAWRDGAQFEVFTSQKISAPYAGLESGLSAR